MKRMIVGVMVVALCASGCGKKAAPTAAAKGSPGAPAAASGTQPSSQGDDDGVQHKVLSFNLEGLTDKGEKKWDVKGESAEAISENEVKLDNIVAKAYGEEAQAVITADKGVYDKTKNNVRLQQNVKATIETTQGFSGDFVDFSGQPKGGDAAASKKGGPDRPQKKSKTIITCDGGVLFDYERNVASFMKNVHVDSEDGSIDADKITVNLDADTKQVREIVAEGNVQIKRGENITYSEKAIYDAVSKKVSLVGRPKLVIYQEGGDMGTNIIGDLSGKK